MEKDLADLTTKEEAVKVSFVERVAVKSEVRQANSEAIVAKKAQVISELDELKASKVSLLGLPGGGIAAGTDARSTDAKPAKRRSGAAARRRTRRLPRHRLPSP